MCNSLRPHDYSLPGSSVHGIFPSKNTGVGHHTLFQGIFPTHGSNPCLLCLLHWQVGSLPLSHEGGPSSIIFSHNIKIITTVFTPIDTRVGQKRGCFSIKCPQDPTIKLSLSVCSQDRLQHFFIQNISHFLPPFTTPMVTSEISHL